MKAAGTFDAWRLARERGVLEGTLDVESSERLEDRLAPGEARIAWRIEGTADELGRPAIAIALAGAVPVTCQRCLTDFELPVEHRTITVLARSEKEADELDASSDHEVVVADHPLDAAGLVEEELLLTLPYAPVHEAECAKIDG
ncbi:MAG: YceD family protein [Burkholderiales bacterium]